MTDSEYMAGIAACLEPQAVSAVRDAKTQIELSTALSLKRIADAMTEAEMIAALEATGHTVIPPDPLVAEREFLAGLMDATNYCRFSAKDVRSGAVDDSAIVAAMAYLRANKGRL